MSISLRTSSSWRLPTLAKFPLPPKVIVPIVSAEILRPELPSCRYSIARSFRTSDRSRWLTTILVERTDFSAASARMTRNRQSATGNFGECKIGHKILPRVRNGRPSLSVELSLPHSITRGQNKEDAYVSSISFPGPRRLRRGRPCHRLHDSRVGQRSACGQGELLRHLIEGPQRLRRWRSQLRGHVEDQLQPLRFQI